VGVLTADGYGSCAAWLKSKGRMTGKAAGAETRRMRQFRDHPVIADAVASGELSQWWAEEMAEWTRRLPDDWRHDVDKLLVDTASAGVLLQGPRPRTWPSSRGPRTRGGGSSATRTATMTTGLTTGS
jgi:hypothetical protein